MDINDYYVKDGEKPLDNILNDGGFCAIFRSIACIGDSLSSGEFEIRGENDSVAYHDVFVHSWGQYIARMTGAKVYNFSRGGMTAKEYMENFAKANDYFNKKYISDAYILALGVNDLNRINNVNQEKYPNIYPDEFGSVSDVDFDDYLNNKKSFIGYYASIIQKYKELQPNAKFFLVTMPKDDRDSGDKKIKFNNAIYSLAQKFDNTFVIDLYNYAPVYDQKFRDNFFLAGHMNPQGYLLTAKMIASYIDYIIRTNHKDFELVGFNGKEFNLQ